MRYALLPITALLLGFAPAPVFKPPRPGEGVSLLELRGDWTLVAQHHITGGKPERVDTLIREIGLEGGRWIHRHRDGHGDQSRDIAIDPGQSPATIVFRNTGCRASCGNGILRRHGETLHVLAVWGAFLPEKDWPKSFDRPPEGATLFILRRAK